MPTDVGEFAPELTIAHPTLADASDMWRVATVAGGLDVNSSYAYLLWCDHFGATSGIARVGDEAVGFVTGFAPPEESETLMIWQIAVKPDHRGKGIALALLNELLDRPRARQFRWLKTTISRSNHPSRVLFAALADDRQTVCSRMFGYSADEFPDDHEAEDLCTIGPMTHYA